MSRKPHKGEVCISWAAKAERALLGIKSSKTGSMWLFLWLSLGGSVTSSCCWWPRLRETFGTVPPDLILVPEMAVFQLSSLLLLSCSHGKVPFG